MKTPADWERIRELFHHALALPPDERAAFLCRETGADEDSRREVESLLAAHADADGFLSDSPVRATGTDDLPAGIGALPRGTRLGAFEILGLLGAGGMGEVYRARDTRLDREVAIKVLSRDLAGDPDGRDRFEREARAISRLYPSTYLHAVRCRVRRDRRRRGTVPRDGTARRRNAGGAAG